MVSVSVIMPSYNSEKYISESIESVINQSFQDWELIITDDCSTDHTVNIVKSYQITEKRITLLQLNINSGAAVARNNSIKNSKGRFIAFLDSDDKWLPTKLDKQVNFMIKNKLFFTYSGYIIVNEVGKIKKTVKGKKRLTLKHMIRNNYVHCLTAIYDSHGLGKMLMPKLRKRQDWALWLKIFMKIKETNGIAEPLGVYRVRSKSISSNKLGLIKHNWQIYRIVLGYNLIQSSFLIIQFLIFYILKKINI